MASDTQVAANNTQEPENKESELFPIRSIQFPPDTDPTGTDGYQRHFVRFTINLDEESKLIKQNKVEATDVDNSSQNRFRAGPMSQTKMNAVGALVGASLVGGSSATKALASRFKGFGKKALVTATATAAGAAMGYNIADTFNVTKKLKKLAASITLYTPGNISSSYNIGYSATDDVTAELLKLDKGAELLQDAETGEKSAFNVPGKLARIVGVSGSDLIQNLTRTARNPKKDMLFREVGNRQFQFEYVFAPKSAADSYDVANIIYMFKYFAHPELLEGYDQFLYIYPAEFDIEYLYKTAGEMNQNMWLNKISSCVLESIDVNYAPNGSFQSLLLGEPVITTMVLRFKEIETLHRDRIAAGL